MSDSYYELIDPADPLGERFRATDMVRSTWSSHIQHGGPVSALLVRAMERCERRPDTRLSRVVVDLLGGVPADGDLWVTATLERGGKQIELVSAVLHGQGRTARRARWPGPAAGGSRRWTPPRWWPTRCRRCPRASGDSTATSPRSSTATTCTARNGCG